MWYLIKQIDIPAFLGQFLDLLNVHIHTLHVLLVSKMGYLLQRLHGKVGAQGVLELVGVGLRASFEH
jgi:hypothetical protein